MLPSNFRSVAIALLSLACLLPQVGWAQQKGTVTGTVFDAQTSRPITGAKVLINGQTGDGLSTDTSGAFRIELSPGTYTVKFTADNYADVEVTDLQVVAGTVVDASTVMANKNTVTTVEVNEKLSAVSATAEALLTERKLAAVVSDSISNEELKKGTSSDAAGALQKVTGVSIVDNGFVYVRGLGERYSATTLNSALIPTTEPEKRVVPLDLFPSALIDNVKILKTYSPDLPGEFSGGLVQLTTVDFPAQRLFQASVSYGFNTTTTFNRFASYDGAASDFLGVSGSGRDIPAIIPRDRRVFSGAFTQAQTQQFGRSFAPNWQPRFQDSARPNQTYTVVGGNTYGKWGIIGALTFTNKVQLQSEQQNYYRRTGSGGKIDVFSSYPQFDAYTESPRLGGVFNIAYKINNNHKIVLRNTVTRDTDKEARQFSGLDNNQGGTISDERLRWVERSLVSHSLEGDHVLEKFKHLLAKWQFTVSTSNRKEPDLREVIRGQADDGRFFYIGSGSSGLRFFNTLEDRIYEPQGEISQPFFKGQISGIWKVGFRGTFRHRDFEARRFRFLLINSNGIDLSAPSNTLFQSANIRPDGFALREETRSTDTYQGDFNIFAGYAMADVAIGSKWRVVGGVRIEDADLEVNTIDPLIPGGIPATAKLVNRDPLPGVNVIYAITPKQNIRVSYSQTVSRPDFRELSPFDFTNVVGGFNVAGNPNLRRAKINNFDVRWEWFTGGNQVFAASFFTKDFTDPIESTIQPTTDLRTTFINARGAINRGFELELRRNLGNYSKRLKDFAASANFTFVDSNVRLRPEDATIVTSQQRPLLGQSRYIYNVQAEWTRPQLRSSARFYVNSVSRRITEVGTFGLPDIYQERNLFIDAVYQYSFTESGRWQLKFNAENLADNRYFWTQQDLLQRQYRLGRTFTVGFTYSAF